MNLALPGTDGLNGGGEALLEEFGAPGGDSTQIRRDGGGGENKRQSDQREQESGDAGRKEHVVGVFDIEPEGCEGYVLHGLDVLEYRECKKKEKC